MKRIVVLTTDGNSREDCNVFYSRYIIVESSTLKFDEPVFDDDYEFPPLPDPDDNDDAATRMEAAIEVIKNLGYTVEEPDSVIIAV